MSRRFVGFTVQLAEDKWLCMDHNSCSAVVGPKEHRGYWPTRTDAEADILDAGESIEAARVSPVFAVPKGTFASFVAHCDRVGRIAEPKPAPVVAGEGLADDGSARPPVIHVYVAHRGVSGAIGIYAAHTHDEAAELCSPSKGVTRYVREDRHEAACEAAVQAERTRLLAAIKGQRVEIMGAADGKNGIEAVRLYGQVDGLDFVRTLLGDKDVP